MLPVEAIPELSMGVLFDAVVPTTANVPKYSQSKSPHRIHQRGLFIHTIYAIVGVFLQQPLSHQLLLLHQIQATKIAPFQISSLVKLT